MADLSKVALSLAGDAIKLTEDRVPVYNIKEFDVDGTFTGSMKNAASVLADRPAKIIFDQGVDCELLEPTYWGSNKEFSFNNNRIIWRGQADKSNTQWRDIGMLNFHGSISETGYAVADTLFLGNFRDTDQLNKLATDGTITLSASAVHDFVPGDQLYLDLNTGAYSDVSLRPKARVLMNVVYVSGQKLWVDYSNPWEIDKVGVAKTGTVWKVNACKNIVIIGSVELYDELVITSAKDPVNPYPGRDRFVSGLSFKYASGVYVEDIKGFNTKFPLVFTLYSTDIHIDKLTLISPAIVGDGEGYGAQFNYSSQIKAYNFYSEGARHLIDFTGSCFARVVNAKGVRSYSNTFQQHGFYEHNISYEHTEGAFNGASGTAFGNASRHISFFDHKGIIAGSYMDDYDIDYSTIRLTKAPSNSNIKNSKVYLSAGGASGFSHESRTPIKERNTTFTNCVVDIYADTGFTGMFRGFINLTFERCTITNTLNTTNGFLTYLEESNIQFIDCPTIDSVRFAFRGSSNQRVLGRGGDFIGNINTDDYLFSGSGTSDCTISITLQNADFKSARPDGGLFKLLKFAAETMTNTNVIVNLLDNNLDKCDVIIEATSLQDVIKTSNILANGTTVTVAEEVAYKHVNDITIT